MSRRSWHGLVPSPSFLLVASDPVVIAAARDAARRLDAAHPVQIISGVEALSRLVGPGDPPRHLVLDAANANGTLLAAARDRFGATEVVVVAAPGDAVPDGLRAAPAEGARLAQALTGLPRPANIPVDPVALEASLRRGEITVRFQPVVRLADRRPVGVEALARWERPEQALGAAAFVEAAERAGLATLLTLVVARRALMEFAAARPAGGFRLSVNVPLSVLLEPDLAPRLAAIVGEAGLVPDDLRLELTETTVVRDAGLLRRALQRLARSGFGVLLDDLALGDPRDELLALPFAGVKLDRSAVERMPHSRRIRGLVERLVRRAHGSGRFVVAEGVSDPVLWRCAQAAGCDLAQGFAVGRPILPEALPAWIAAWRRAEVQPA